MASQIEKDLLRTFPGHPLYLRRSGLAALRRLLTLYSRYNTNVGYCQSLNFLTGFLLLYMPEVGCVCVCVIFLIFLSTLDVSINSHSFLLCILQLSRSTCWHSLHLSSGGLPFLCSLFFRKTCFGFWMLLCDVFCPTTSTQSSPA
jgi:Rab-GTPase-TBC domain